MKFQILSSKVPTTLALGPKLDQHTPINTLKSLEQFSQNMISLPRWEGGGGVSISYCFNTIVTLPTPAFYIMS